MNTTVSPLPPTPQATQAPAAPPGLPVRRVAVLVVLMLVAALAGEKLRPTDRLAERKARINLEQQVPEAFGEWQIDRNIRPVVPDPGLQAMLDSLYSQTLARTYVNKTGQRVMLSIAYGSDQGSEATAVHRPEFCYSAQGFRVQTLAKEQISIAGTSLPVARVVARLGQRVEPISYWVTLDETATLPGFGRKLQQIRFGLNGQIPDGMLVRVSTISNSTEESFAMQQQFLEQMFAAVPAAVKSRYFGAGKSTAPT
jgi:EpsI family protein